MLAEVAVGDQWWDAVGEKRGCGARHRRSKVAHRSRGESKKRHTHAMRGTFAGAARLHDWAVAERLRKNFSLACWKCGSVVVWGLPTIHEMVYEWWVISGKRLRILQTLIAPQRGCYRTEIARSFGRADSWRYGTGRARFVSNIHP